MKTSGIPMGDLPPHVQALVRAADSTAGRKNPPRSELLQKDGATAAPGARLRQSGKGPNKTEAAFAAHVRACYPGKAVHEQALTLVLANGLRYTPDVFLPSGRDGGPRPAFYEVKGFMRDDAAAKIKMAAEIHRWADFFLVSRKGRTCLGWNIQVILPRLLTGAEG